MTSIPESGGAEDERRRRPRAILSSVPCDSHTWNLLYLQLLLEEHGWSVSNLGACVPVELLRREAVADPPDLVVVSTVNGHGGQDGLRVIRALRAEPVLADVPVVIGGKPGTRGGCGAAERGELTAAGYDGVFLGARAVPEFLAFLAAGPLRREPVLSKRGA